MFLSSSDTSKYASYSSPYPKVPEATVTGFFMASPAKWQHFYDKAEGAYTRLIGGMVRRIAESLHKLRIPATLAVAATPGAAFALSYIPPKQEQRNTTGVRTLIAKSLAALAEAPDDQGVYAHGVNLVDDLSQPPTLAVREISNRVPSSFSLQQNYANACNPSTTIR